MLRKLSWLIFVPVLSLVILSVMLVSAGTFRSPARDTACWLSFGQCANNQGVTVESSSDGTQCVPSTVAYIGWDLGPDAAKIWKSAAMTLTAYSVVPGSGAPPYTFALYPVLSEVWTEDDSIKAGPGYSSATPLAVAIDDLTDNQVVFRDDASNKLGTYFLGKKGGAASVALVLTAGCGGGTTGFPTIISFEDIEGTTGAGYTRMANVPSGEVNPKAADLVFYTGDATNAVTLRTFRSADPAVNWPLIAGGLLLAVLLGGAGVYRWRLSRVRAR